MKYLLPLLLLHLVVVWGNASAKQGPNFIELKSKLSALGHNAAVVQGELQLKQLESVQDLSNLLDMGRQKLAETRLVLDQTPAAPAAAPAAPAPAAAAAAPAVAAAAAATDLIQPPQLQPLALPSYGPQMQIDELADIQREQLALRQKKLLVAQQKRIIQDSEDNASKLQQLISVNKQIAEKNDEALVAANQHLTDRIKAYGERLAKEAAGTPVTATPAPGATAAALLESQSSDDSTDSSSQAVTPSTNTQFLQFQTEIQQTLKTQNSNIERLEEMLVSRRRRRRLHRRAKSTPADEDNTDNTDNDSEEGDHDKQDTTTKPVTS